MTMAGFVSTEKRWLKFEREWNAVLTQFEVPYLHMKEFAHSKGPFETWKGNEERRTQFLIDLIKVAKKGVHKGSVCSVRFEDFEDVNKDFRLREHWGCEYSFIGMSAVTRIMNWKKKRFPDARIKYIFEDGDLGNTQLKKCLQEEQLPHAFVPKKENQNGIIKYIMPFQIADFAAWENRAAYARNNEGHYDGGGDDPLLKLRRSFQALYKQIPCDWMVVSNERLRGLCNAKSLSRIPFSASPVRVVDNPQTFED